MSRSGSRTESSSSPSASAASACHWSMGLVASMGNPDLRVDADEEMVIIRDKYPKAKFHFLILPKENIPNLKSLKKQHVKLLKHIHKKGEELAERLDNRRQFKFGYHAIPSMGHLHMHVISQDFNSPCLKTKKHWNSFTSEYFIDSTEIIKQLEESGCIKVSPVHYEEILKRKLRCHVCEREFPTMPKLKAHTLTHSYSKTA